MGVAAAALAGRRGRARGSSSRRRRGPQRLARQAASGARPRLVWTITPVALSTRRSDGCSSCGEQLARPRQHVRSCGGSSPAQDLPTALVDRPPGRRDRERVRRLQRGGELVNGGQRPQARGLGVVPAHPLALLLLPDRRLRLDLVDDLAGAGERLLAVRGRRRDGDRRLGQRHGPDPVLGGGGAQAVALDRLRDDLGDLALGHLRVGLVLELGDLAGDTEERHHRAGPRVAHALDQRVERQRLVGDARVELVDRAARHRRDQRQLVAGVQRRVGRRRTPG